MLTVYSQTAIYYLHIPLLCKLLRYTNLTNLHLFIDYRTERSRDIPLIQWRPNRGQELVPNDHEVSPQIPAPCVQQPGLGRSGRQQVYRGHIIYLLVRYLKCTVDHFFFIAEIKDDAIHDTFENYHSITVLFQKHKQVSFASVIGDTFNILCIQIYSYK